MAFACRPRVIVLDEPTTGLDVTTQAHVLNTVRELTAAAPRRRRSTSATTWRWWQRWPTRVAVMYAGRVVEVGPSEELFNAPAHPYTRRLIAAIPHISGKRQLAGIPGRAPSPGSRPKGCFFAPRCGWKMDDCRAELPPLRDVAAAHSVRCIRAEEVMAEREPARRRRRCRPTEVPAETAVLSLRRRARRLRRPHGAARHQPRAGAAGVPGAGGRVGLGQDHAGALDRRAPPRAPGRDAAERRAAGGVVARRARARPGARSSTSSRTPTARSTRAARSARSCRSRWSCSAPPAAASATSKVGDDAGAGVADGRLRRRATPTSCPAASASGWRSRGRWCASRRC